MSDGQWADWIGKSETLTDTCGPSPVRAMAATLNRPRDYVDGDTISPLYNWLYFLPFAPMSGVDDDGHPKRGGFLPPIAHPRRMWAGSRMTFHGEIKVGDALAKTSTIKSIAEKDGGAGPMVFVTVTHEVRANGALCITEEQDIVYMNIAPKFTPPKARPLPGDCAWAEDVALDPVLLFRFSALTFNGHRIHYDRPYAVETENYPGLVVHGPLQAIMLYDAAVRNTPGRTPTGFTFRGIRPLFEHDTLTLNARTGGDELELMTANGDRTICCQAKLTWG